MIASNVIRRRSALAATAALAAGLALPGVAAAQGVAAERVPVGTLLVVDGSGRTVGMLVPSTATPAAATAEPDPLAELMALQSAMMRQMQAQMTDVARIADGPEAGGTASGLVVRSVTTGSNGCSRTVVWRQGPSDPAPKMVLDRIADHCAGTAPGVQSPGLQTPGLQTIVDLHAPAEPVVKRPF